MLSWSFSACTNLNISQGVQVCPRLLVIRLEGGRCFPSFLFPVGALYIPFVGQVRGATKENCPHHGNMCQITQNKHSGTFGELPWCCNQRAKGLKNTSAFEVPFDVPVGSFWVRGQKLSCPKATFIPFRIYLGSRSQQVNRFPASLKR